MRYVTFIDHVVAGFIFCDFISEKACTVCGFSNAELGYNFLFVLKN